MPFRSASEMSTVITVPGETLMTVEVTKVNRSPLPSAFLCSVKPVMTNDITSITSSNVRSSTPKSMSRANSSRVGGMSSLMTSLAMIALPSVMATMSSPRTSSRRLLSTVMCVVLMECPISPADLTTRMSRLRLTEMPYPVVLSVVLALVRRAQVPLDLQ